MERIYGIQRIAITVVYKLGVTVKKETVFLDFKLSQYSELCTLMLSDFPAFELYLPTFRNTLFRLHRRRKQEEGTQCSEMSSNKIQTPGDHTKKEYYETAFA